MLYVTMTLTKRTIPPDSSSFCSVVPSLPGKYVQHVNDGTKHSMEQEATDKKQVKYAAVIANISAMATWYFIKWVEHLVLYEYRISSNRHRPRIVATPMYTSNEINAPLK